MYADFLPTDSPRWSELLAQTPHDVYQLPEYVRFAARHQDPGEPLAFLAEEDGRRFLVPLIVRPIEASLDGNEAHLCDATSPRDYPGPLLRLEEGDDGEDFLSRAVDTFRDHLRQRRIIAAYLRLHPLFPLLRESLERVGLVVLHQESVSIDLSLAREELWRQTRHNHRRDINRAARRGHVARIDASDQAYDEFFDIYQETMRRIGANSFWLLSSDYVVDLRQTLGSRLHLCVVEIDDEIAAGGLFTEVDGIVEYLLSGTREPFLAVRPTKTMLNFVRCWAKERGNRIFHLGGSAQAEDSLFAFKAGFSPNRHPVLSWRIVADPMAHETLVRDWSRNHATAADDLDGFFPAYRKLAPQPSIAGAPSCTPHQPENDTACQSI